MKQFFENFFFSTCCELLFSTIFFCCFLHFIKNVADFACPQYFFTFSFCLTSEPKMKLQIYLLDKPTKNYYSHLNAIRSCCCCRSCLKPMPSQTVKQATGCTAMSFQLQKEQKTGRSSHILSLLHKRLH